MESSNVHQCPACGYKLEAHTAPGEPDAIPRPNDLTVCVGCTEALIFDKDLKPQRWSPELLSHLTEKHPEVIASLERIKEAVRRAKKRQGDL